MFYGSPALNAIRRGELVRQLIDYAAALETGYDKKSHVYDCGSEFGAVRVFYDYESRTNEPECWEIEWVTVEECPIDLNSLPKKTRND